jgi:DNA-binding transcriptional LysR family regulator
MVIDGGCELAMTYLPVQHGGLRVRRLGTQETWVVLPPDTPAGPDPLPVGVLDGLPVVQGTDGFEAASAAVRSAVRAAGVRMRTAVVSRHSEAILPLVLAGAGVAFTTERHARQAADAGAVIRRLDPSITVPYAVLHRKASLSPAAQAFLDVLLTELPPAGAG